MDKRQIEKECYSLEESKAKLLQLVHRHFENKAETCSFTTLDGDEAGIDPFSN